MTKNCFRYFIIVLLGVLPYAMIAQSNTPTNSETERLLEKKKAQLSIPEFKNQAEKDAWVKSQEKKQKEEIIQKESINPFTTISTESEKNDWISKNQAIYNGKSEEPQKIRVTRQEFDSLPSDKQNAMKNDSNYIIEQK
jgi:hypothetical protein